MMIRRREAVRKEGYSIGRVQSSIEFKDESHGSFESLLSLGHQFNW